MKTWLAMLAGVVMTGCCSDASRLTIIGDSPPDTATVLLIAQEHCPRTITGTLTWRAADSHRGGGCRKENDWHCPLDAWVNTDGETTAIYTDLAHELGHWCMRTSSQGRAEAFAVIVYDEAVPIIFGQ